MTPTRLHSKLLSTVPKIEYIEPYTLNGCGFEMADPVEMEKPLAEWAIATTVIDREDSNFYKVYELAFPLTDETEATKQLVVWGESPQNHYKVSELTFSLADEREGKKLLAVWGKNPQHYMDTVCEYVYMEEKSYMSRLIEQLYEYELKIFETPRNNICTLVCDTLSVGANKQWKLDAEIYVPIKIVEVLGNATAREHSESVSIRSKSWNDINLNKSEKIAASESMQKKWNSIRDYVEALEWSDKGIKKILAYKHEEVDIKDKRMRATMNGVLSNVSISEGAESYEDFQRTADKVAGYTSFIEFKVGDYEYQDAIYRLTITRKNLNAETLIYDYAVHVDIPDTFDRGESAVSGETNIYFNKHYYHAPEVNVTVTGGTEILIPRIITLNGKDDNGRYFTVILENSAGESKSGRISWSARGY